jgi:hypothetical protein
VPELLGRLFAHREHPAQGARTQKLPCANAGGLTQPKIDDCRLTIEGRAANNSAVNRQSKIGNRQS